MHKVKKLTFFLFLSLFILTGTALGQHKLTLSLTGMGIHVGQPLYVRVIDTGMGDEVGRTIIQSLPGASYDVELYVLVVGHNYRIDFFADVNSNGMYDTPPTDHAYRVEVDNIQGDVTANFAHSGNFTDIGWDYDFDISQYEGDWVGYWINRTYGSTAVVNATVQVVPDSQIVRVTSTSSLILGNPDVETKTGAGYYNSTEDSIFVNAPPPWTGTATATHGEIKGTGAAPDFGGTNIQIQGNFGPKQMITNFFITGPFDADGVIILTRIETSVDEEDVVNQPSEFILSQNYPNPFNPKTMIKYHLTEPGFVSLKVYSLLGKELDTLVSERKEQGEHVIQWNAGDLPSGVYFYKLVAGDRVETRNMVLQR